MELNASSLREARRAARVTQQQAADHLGVYIAVYAWYENGKVPIPSASLQ